MFTIYVIKSKTTGKIYIGQTNNFEKRLSYHNNKNFNKRPYTKIMGKDWFLVYTEFVSTRKEALRREKELKSSRGKKLYKIYY